MSARCCIVLLLLISVGAPVIGRKIKSNTQCVEVKQSFMEDKPSVASTITTKLEHDNSLELCRFTNHSESNRLSCCTHDTENEMLKTAQAEYTTILTNQTAEVIAQMEPGRNLKSHYERMISISKRMTEYEVGNALHLHHILDRSTIQDFYDVLKAILIDYDRSTSIFTATDNLINNLFVYVVRQAVNPDSTKEPTEEYAACVKSNWKALNPSPFKDSLQNRATSIHYSAVASSYLAEAMDVTFEALNATRYLQLSHHCLRDLMKMNHCQKCYGYTDLRPCREFCEDVFLVCLNRVVRLSSNWGYHRKIIKILAEYILNRVELQSLLNTFHTELKSSFEEAIINYSSYKKQLQVICGEPKMVSRQGRLKAWEKPQTTSYEGDFTGDLGKLVVNLEKNIQGFYSNLHSSICATEPQSTGSCWDGLTERVDKEKKILEFSDEFAPYPGKNDELSGLLSHIKRIRSEVLRIFLKNSDQNSDDEVNGSGSGDGEGTDEDSEPGDDANDVVPTRGSFLGKKPEDIVTSKLSTIYQNAPKDGSIEVVDEPVTRGPPPKSTRLPPASKSPVINNSPAGSSAAPLTYSLLIATSNVVLTYLVIHH